MNKFPIILLFSASIAVCFAQPQGTIPITTSNPAGVACNANQLLLYISGTTGQLFTCVSGVFTAPGSGTFVQLSGDAVSGVTGGPTTVSRLNGQALSALATGILKNTTATGVPSIALSGDVVQIFGSGTCSGYLKSDGTCDVPVVGGVTAATLAVPILPTPTSLDASLGFNDAGTAGKTIFLQDGATYNGSNLGFQSNVTYKCTNCVIACLPVDPTTYCFNIGSKTNLRFEGVTFDGMARNTGSFQGANVANTAVTIATAGSGFVPNQSIGMGFTGGGCSLLPSGYMTVNGTGNATGVVLTQTGVHCTSAPTVSTTFTGYPACPRGGTCVAPTFNYPVVPTNTAGTGAQDLWFVNGATNLQFDRCTFQSTGSSVNDGSRYTGGLHFFNASATVTNSSFKNTVAGTQIKADTNATTKPLVLTNNLFDGSGFDAVQIYSSNGGSSAGNVKILGGTCTNVFDASFGTGQAGNCYSLFKVSNSIIDGTTSINPRFSGIRVTGSSSAGGTTASYNTITNNKVIGCGEAAYWFELGAELNSLIGNFASNCNTAYHSTNSSQRPTGSGNIAIGNVFTGMLAFCAGADFLDVYNNNECTDSPVGLVFGTGGTGKNLNPSGNTFKSSGNTGAIRMAVAVTIDKTLTNTTNNTGLNLGVNLVDGAGVLPYIPTDNTFVGFSTLNIPNIVGMTNANPAVFTVTTMSAGAMNNNEVWFLFNIPSATLSDGTTPVTGQFCTLAAVSTTSFTCSNLNTLGGVAFTLPLYGNAAASADKIYSSGTTWAYTWPAMVTVDVPRGGNPSLTAGGCTAALVAGATSTAGSITTATGTCTAAALTPGFTAPHGWQCGARDRTTPANPITFTPTSTTVTSFSGTSTANDTIDYICQPW